MAIRLVCPSCSAALSVKDEFAGRPVKCPKCAGVIPPPPPSAEPPLPPMAEPFAAPEQSAPPRVTARPVSSARDSFDDDRTPRRERDRDRDRDRPPRRDRNYDDGPPPRKEGGSSGVLIVAIICGTLLLCCGGAGFGIYWFVMKAKEEVVKIKDEAMEKLEKWNPRITEVNYGQLKIGSTTREQADQRLGSGRLATADDLPTVFAANPGRADAWRAKVNENRAVIWRNNDDYIIAAFHPNTERGSRIQATEWLPKSGIAARAGELDDAQFVQKYPPLTPKSEIRAEDISQEFLDNRDAAMEKYSEKTFIVVGKLTGAEEWGSEIKISMKGAPVVASKGLICTLRGGETPFKYSRGQMIKVSGKCTGGFKGDAYLTDCVIIGAVDDPTVKVSAAALISDYGRQDVADAKYKDKELTVQNATVVKVEEDQEVILRGAGKNGEELTIRASFDAELRNRFTFLRPGAAVTVRGTCTGLSGKEIIIKEAWFTQP